MGILRAVDCLSGARLKCPEEAARAARMNRPWTYAN
jgi:hypothetical protein